MIKTEIAYAGKTPIKRTYYQGGRDGQRYGAPDGSAFPKRGRWEKTVREWCEKIRYGTGSPSAGGKIRCGPEPCRKGGDANADT